MRRINIFYLRQLFNFLPSWAAWSIVFVFIVIIAIWFGRRPVINNFEQAKYYLENDVFYDHPYTLYCNAQYDENKNIILPSDIRIQSHSKRMQRMEWEHMVPVENFGRNFSEWNNGHADCVSEGKKYYGRKCVKQVNAEFRKIEADLYNIYPAIGAVNAVRGKKDYALLADGYEKFGECGIKVKSKKFEPPDRAKGITARASLYMDEQYKEFQLSPKQKSMFESWSRQFPVDEWECLRAARIKKLQRRANHFIEEQCIKAGYYKK